MTSQSMSRTERDAERAERLASAQRAANAFGRWLFFAATIELVAAIVRTIAAPSATPVVLADLAAVSRCVTAIMCAIAMIRFAPLAAVHGLGAHAQTVAGLYFTTAVIPLLRFFDIVPPHLSEPHWDAILIGTYGAAFVLTTLGAAWFVRQLAIARRRLMVAHRIANATFLPFVLLPLLAFAITPELSPHPAVAAALALATPWLLTCGAGRRLFADQAAWLTLGLGTALGLAVFFGPPLLSAGLALAATAAITAFAFISALHLFSDELSGRDAEGPSATFLRRLVAGTLGGVGSRVGDLPKDSQLPGDESDGEESLALAYRELGIERPAPPNPTLAADLAELPDQLVPFVPKSRQHGRPHDPGPIRHDWSFARRGLRLFFGATLALTLLTSFSVLFGLTPLGTMPFALAVHAIALSSIAAISLRGAGLLVRGLPAVAPHGLPRLLQLVTGIAVASSLLLAIDSFIASSLPASLMTALAFIATYLMLSTLLTRLGTALDEPRVTTRARTAMWLAAALALVTTLRHLVLSLDASDLRWLAWPIGLVTVGVFLALAMVVLWLLKDAESAAERLDLRPPG